MRGRVGTPMQLVGDEYEHSCYTCALFKKNKFFCKRFNKPVTQIYHDSKCWLDDRVYKHCCSKCVYYGYGYMCTKYNMRIGSVLDIVDGKCNGYKRMTKEQIKEVKARFSDYWKEKKRQRRLERSKKDE